MTRCQFEMTYFDFLTSKNESFKCEEDALDNGVLCLFHDEYYLEDNNPEKEQKLFKRLEEKISESISKDQPLFCIGYHFPGIRIEKKFTKVVYFSFCKFQYAEFSGSTFSSMADFSGTNFSGTTFFIRSRFLDEAFFNGAEFSSESETDKTEFSDAAFFSLASFRGARFHNSTNFLAVNFSGKIDFSATNFFNQADFSASNFSKEVSFSEARFLSNTKFSYSKFLDEAYFSGKFNGSTYFNYTIFEKPNKVTFDVSDMSNVSFSDSDITRIKFSDKVKWGGDDKFTIIEEKWLMEAVEGRNKSKLKKKPIEKRNNESQPATHNRVSPELVLSVYRNLRENYEFRLRYGDAGKFFIKEMELKRRYREAPSVTAVFKSKLIKLLKKLKLVNINAPEPKVENVLKQNGKLRIHFSLTGLYYHFSTYGESIVKPTTIGIIIVGLSALFWLMQSNPSLQPTFSTNAHFPYSNFTGLAHATNHTQLLKAFERSLSDLLPLLTAPSDIKIGVIDFIVKIVGGALTFVLLGVALRRKFERKYTR